MHRKVFLAGAAAIVAVAASANATVTTYTDEAAFDAALGAVTTEDFSSTTLVPGLSFVSDAGTVSGGVFNDRVVNGGDQTDFLFAGGAYGVGGDFDETPGGFGQGLALSIKDGGGNVTSVTQLDGYSGGFFGLISTTSFTTLEIRGGVTPGSAETYTLDNLQFGGAVPEPASWALMLVGFGGLGLALRGRKASAATA
jgi:hypothetical protein